MLFKKIKIIFDASSIISHYAKVTHSVSRGRNVIVLSLTPFRGQAKINVCEPFTHSENNLECQTQCIVKELQMQDNLFDSLIQMMCSLF